MLRSPQQKEDFLYVAPFIVAFCFPNENNASNKYEIGKQ
jgi:hypothetical protein